MIGYIGMVICGNHSLQTGNHQYIQENLKLFSKNIVK